jgi:hypothetical protein
MSGRSGQAFDGHPWLMVIANSIRHPVSARPGLKSRATIRKSAEADCARAHSQSRLQPAYLTQPDGFSLGQLGRLPNGNRSPHRPGAYRRDSEVFR